jgi:Tol biopolymer transport system component
LIGQTISHFRITAKLGEGGMGEVYRAEDTKLERDVAIKVLPPTFTADSERMARFLREAKVLASLNHQNIAAIHQIEEVDSQQLLVMELVEGEDLADRLRGRPMPIDEALQVAQQVAEGLEAAHARGIVHRDLKPANIKISADGQVKILDFGLAKAAPPPNAEVSESAITAEMTAAGAILGTPAYMSPEQAKGQPADHRADIWSFGVVLYEMLAGGRLFQKMTVGETLAAVLEAKIDWQRLPPAIPPGVRRLLRRCLASDPRQRLHSAADVRIELEEAVGGGPEPSDASIGDSSAQQASRGRALATVTIFALAAGVALGALLWPDRPAATRHVRASILPPTGSAFELHPYIAGGVVVSPDGTLLAFSARPARGPARLWVRRIDESEARVLEGTEGAMHPFWSPDSRQLAFFADGELRRVDAAGSPVVTVAKGVRGLSLHYPGGGMSGTWGVNGEIVFSPGGSVPLQRVPASGGEPVTVEAGDLLSTSLFSQGGMHPRFLPDGDRFLFVSGRGRRGEDHKLMLASLSGDEPRELLRSLSYAEVAGDYLWFARKGALFAQRFDSQRAELLGEPIAVARGLISSVWSESLAQGFFSVSPAGVIAFHTGNAISRSILTWYDRGGRPLGEIGTPEFQYQVSLAPDDGLAMLQIADVKASEWALWTYDLDRGTRSRFTTRPSPATGVWSPDGRRVAFQHEGQIFLQPVGVDVATPLRDGGPEAYGREEVRIAWPLDWTSDGKQIVYATVDRGNISGDLWMMSVEEKDDPVPLQHSPYSEEDAAISPDGRWLAYTSDRSGQYEVYVTEFPESIRSVQVSADGGIRPEWGSSSSELFYLSPEDNLILAPLEASDDGIDVGQVRDLFPLDMQHHVLFEPGGYAVAGDAKRFLVNRVLARGTSSPITLLVGWPPQLEAAERP